MYELEAHVSKQSFIVLNQTWFNYNRFSRFNQYFYLSIICVKFYTTIVALSTRRVCVKSSSCVSGADLFNVCPPDLP